MASCRQVSVPVQPHLLVLTFLLLPHSPTCTFLVPPHQIAPWLTGTSEMILDALCRVGKLVLQPLLEPFKTRSTSDQEHTPH